jgi:hypothetical protein
MTATVQTPADHVIPDEALNRILGLSRTSETDPDGLARVQVVKAPGVVYRVVFGGVVGHLRCDDWDDGTTRAVRGHQGCSRRRRRGRPAHVG